MSLVPAPNLTYTGAPSSAWDYNAWRDAMREHVLRTLPKGAVRDALLMGALYMSRSGEFDAPIAAWAKRLDHDRKTVRRAIQHLEAAALIECVGRSPQHAQVRRYRLLITPPRTAASDPGHGCTRDTGDPQPGTLVTQTRDTGDSQSDEKVMRKKRQGAAATISLFEGPEYDRRVVRALTRVGGPYRECLGLATHYRPTLAQVRNVVANARGLRRTGRLRSAWAFVRSAIQRQDYRLDDQVLAWRRANHRRVQQHHHQAIAAQDQQAQQRAQIERERQEAEAWAEISSDQRQALRADIESALPPAARAMHARYPTDGPIWRSLILDHVMREVGRG